MVIGLGGTVLWIWTIIDCITKEPSEGNDKLIWILLIILTGLIGSLIYLIVRRPKRNTFTIDFERNFEAENKKSDSTALSSVEKIKDMNDAKFISIFRSYDITQAGLIRSVLEQNDIVCYVNNENFSSLNMGGVDLRGMSIMVPETQVKEAVKIIKQHKFE